MKINQRESVINNMSTDYDGVVDRICANIKPLFYPIWQFEDELFIYRIFSLLQGASHIV